MGEIRDFLLVFPFVFVLTSHAKSRKNNPCIRNFVEICSANHRQIFIHRLITMTLFIAYRWFSFKYVPYIDMNNILQFQVLFFTANQQRLCYMLNINEIDFRNKKIGKLSKRIGIHCVMPFQKLLAYPSCLCSIRPQHISLKMTWKTWFPSDICCQLVEHSWINSITQSGRSFSHLKLLYRSKMKWNEMIHMANTIITTIEGQEFSFS